MLKTNTEIYSTRVDNFSQCLEQIVRDLEVQTNTQKGKCGSWNRLFTLIATQKKNIKNYAEYSGEFENGIHTLAKEC